MDENDQKPWFKSIKWNQKGLIPAIVQDFNTKKVLMLAWINEQALQESIATQETVFWSRTRQCLWHKGEQSGHVQKLKEIRLDCDADTVLFIVEQIGGIACHTGHQSCFFYRFQDEQWLEAETRIKNPKEIYHHE